MVQARGVYALRQPLLVFVPLLMMACGSNGSLTSPSPVGQPERANQSLVPTKAAASKQERFEQYRSQLQARLARKGSDLERQPARGDVTRVPLQRRFGHAVAARRTADGRLDYGCFGDAEETASFLTKTPDEAQP